MSTVWLGLGSNIGDRKSHIESAIEALDRILDGIAAAPLYETAPRDYENQEDFLNTVVRGGTGLTPPKLLAGIQAVEREGGRRRDGVAKGPRTIDIDILLWDDSIIRIDDGKVDLTVPHPSMHERLFVLRPLLDLNPDAADPRDGEPWKAKASRLVSQRVMLYRI